MSIVCSSCMITGNNVCYHISVNDGLYTDGDSE